MLYRPATEVRDKIPAKPAVAREFQPSAMALEDAPPPRPAWWILYALIAFLAVAVVWASLTSVDEIVIARGELVTSVPTLVVQPLERVAIKAVHVKVGDVVRKGQVLASLDPTFSAADIAQLRSKLAGYTARAARLAAELASADYAPAPKPDPAQLLEAALFEARKRAYSARLRSYAEDLARLKATLASTRSEVEAVVARIGLLRKVVDMRRKLTEKAVSSEIQLLEAQAQLLAAERDRTQAEGKLAELRHQIESTDAQRDVFVREWREKIADELATVRRERAAAADELAKAVRRHDMVTLVAPADAVVLEIAQRSVGSVLREAEILFTLVPLDVPLEGEVRVLARDVGRVHVGNEVRIKFDAFPFQKYGTGRGRIATLSPDAFRPARGEASAADLPRGEAPNAYYKARVALVDTTLRDTPPGFRLLPGMTVTAEIKVGRRSVMSYLLYPILKGLDGSLREP